LIKLPIDGQFVITPLKQGFRDQNRLSGLDGYHTLTPQLIVDPGLQNPISRACFSPSLTRLIRMGDFLYPEGGPGVD
jgi:hypothetical protein